MKNFTQTISFFATALMSTMPDLKLPENARIAEALHDLASGKGDPAELKAEILALLPEQTKEEMVTLGVESPADIIQMHMNFGSLLFDLIMQVSPQPTSPLKIALHQKMIQSLAEKLAKDDFELDEAELAKLRGVLEVEDAYRGGPDEADRKYTQLSPQGTLLFNEIMLACMNLFEDTALAK